MTSRERFLTALRRQPLDRPPVWIMRQAGRYLPEYRALKQQHSFLEMVRTPELACEVTLQPLRRFALDAAILFSDILILPEALGQPYHFRDSGGIGMDFALTSPADIERLDPSAIPGKLAYVAGALDLIRAAIGPDMTLLGFGGSPWTLATYMVEGGSSKDFTRAKQLYYSDRPAFELLMRKLVDGAVQLFRMQIEHGADAIQIFDSWGSACPGHEYEAMSLRWIREIIAQLPTGFPVIIYAKGMAHHANALIDTGACALSVDWSVDLAALHEAVGHRAALQGNLDPVLMELDGASVAAAARALLERMRGRPGHIFNLGHGITPAALPENVETLVDTIVNFPQLP